MQDWSSHRVICTDAHMAMLRRTACELAIEQGWSPVFEVRKDPGSSLPYWQMGNMSGSISFSLTHDMSIDDLRRRFALLMKLDKETCAICFEGCKGVACHKCGERFCHECYIKLFTKGIGVITCPFCRSTTGRKITVNQVSSGIREIRLNIENRQKSEARHALVEQTRAELEEKGRKAEILFAAARKVCPGDTVLLDPTSWLANQVQMRVSWEKYQTEMNSSPSAIRHLMMNNEFAEYMRFMYTSYLDGFGRAILDKHGRCDGAEVYSDLVTHAHEKKLDDEHRRKGKRPGQKQLIRLAKLAHEPL